jgi:hypothetical protein
VVAVRTRLLSLAVIEQTRCRHERYSRVGRMRAHRRRTLINSMRPIAGDFDSYVFVQVCKAFFVLPEEIGLPRPTGE